MLFRNDISARNLAIVVMRFFAAVLITQSHIACLLPPNYQFAVVGADLGDGLFFFCAGFSIFLGRPTDGFVQWYSRKIVRILPPFLMMGLIISLFFGARPSFIDVVCFKGYWFVQAIMIYYVLLYFVKRFCIEFLRRVLAVSCVLLIAYGLTTLPFGAHFQVWGVFRFFSVFFFPVMLYGAVVGYEAQGNEGRQWPIWLCTGMAGLSLVVHFGTKAVISWGIVTNWTEFQLITMFAVVTFIAAMYRLFDNARVKQWVRTSRLYRSVYFVSSLTLEIYIVNSFVINRAPGVFPWSIPVAYFLIVCSAYMLKVTTNLLLQILRDNKIVWRSLLIVD